MEKKLRLNLDLLDAYSVLFAIYAAFPCTVLDSVLHHCICSYKGFMFTRHGKFLLHINIIEVCWLLSVLFEISVQHLVVKSDGMTCSHLNIRGYSTIHCANIPISSLS